MDVGVEFGHYRVIEHIGRGGMADVWSARDKRLNRTVAIKTIARNLSNDMDPVKLFEREARTIARLEHPHILPIYDFGEYQGQLYIVMRYVPGGSVEGLLESGALAIEEVMRLARPIAQALDYAHTNKVVHLDLKPSNILLDSYGSPYLADFGLATVMGPEGRAINPGSGTLLYMAPEQLTANVLDLRADVYSYSVMLYHMISGRLPFDGASPLAIRQLQSFVELPMINLDPQTIAADITEVLRKGTQLDLQKRSQSIMEVYLALEQAMLGGSLSTATMSAMGLNPTTRVGRTKPFQAATTPANPDQARTLAFNTAAFDSRIEKPETVNPAQPEIDEGLRTKTALDVEQLGYMKTMRVDEMAETADLIKAGKLPAPEAKDLSPTSPDMTQTDPLPSAIDKSAEEAQTVQFASSLKAVPPNVSPTTPLNIINTMNRARLSAESSLDLELALEESADETDLPEGTDAAARREAVLIYTRARRVWAGGQGRFLLGATHFTLLNDFYTRADEYRLNVDESGMQMLLRGALEYDYEIDHWWGKLTDESRRWVALHTIRSQNAPARIRALERLEALPDSQPPQIANAVAALIENEVNDTVRRAAIRVLEVRGLAAVPSPRGMLALLDDPVNQDCWRGVAFSPQVDGVLANAALDSAHPDTADYAARVIGRVGSDAAVRHLIDAHKAGSTSRRSLGRTLGLIRDEAASLPTEVGLNRRIGAWLANTARRLLDNPSQLAWRFLIAAVGGWLAMSLYVWDSTPGVAFLDPGRYGLIISIGLTFGVFIGLLVLFASEFPSRLRRFWHWWGRGLVSAVIGYALGWLTWAAFGWFFLQLEPGDNLRYVAIGTAIGMAIPVMIRLPAWVSALVTAAGIGVPLYWAWIINTTSTETAPITEPILYFYESQNVPLLLGTMMLIIGFGAYGGQLWRGIRALLGHAAK